MTVEYFGNNITTGVDSYNTSTVFVLKAQCPGTGLQQVVSLEKYSQNTVGTGYARLAIYSGPDEQNLTLVAQGSAKFHSSNTLQWHGHTEFVDADGDPITPILTAGEYYWLSLTVDADGANEHNRATDMGSPSEFYGLQNCTDGFPATNAIGTETNYIHDVRAGVQPFAADMEFASSDSTQIILDRPLARLSSHMLAGISDSLMVPTDMLYPLPIEAIHYDAECSDVLQIIGDIVSARLSHHISASAIDTLQVISDSIRAGRIRMEGAARMVAPLSLTPRSGIDPIYLAAHPVRHPSRYYEPRIRSYGSFDRSIACPVGFVRTGDGKISVLDPDNSIRQRLAPKTIRKAKAEVRLGPEGGSLSSFLRPFIREVGTVEQPGDGLIDIPLHDFTADWMEWQVPTGINRELWPNAPEQLPEFANIIVGNVSSETGAIPCPLIDIVNFQYLVAQHPCKSVEVYRKRFDEDIFTLVDSAEYELSVLEFSTLIHFAIDQEGAEIRANVEGLFDADTGDLLFTNFADCIKEVWLYLVGVTNSMDRLNLGSFDDVKAKTADLICQGAWTQPITFGEAFTQLQRSSNIDMFNDKNDRITLAYTADDDEPSLELDDTMRLYHGTVKQQLADPTFNRIPYFYSHNFADGTWAANDAYDNLPDQAALGDVVEEEALNMYFVRDEDTAAAVVEHRAQWLDLDSFRFAGEIPLVPTVENLELAQLVRIAHFGGIKEGGYTAEQFKITDLSMDIDNLEYRFKGIRRKVCEAPDRIESMVNGAMIGVNARLGPYSRGNPGEMFAVFVSGSNNLRIQYTTDFGLTWNPMATGNEPSLGDEIQSYDSFTAGDGLIHCVTQEASGRVAYHTFSMTGSTWTRTDEEVIASASNGGRQCVSIECRYPGGEPVIYWQGDKVLKEGVYYARGYYSIKQGGSWSSAELVTPDPGTYPENFGQWGAGCISSDCFIQRVISGRENRMHFFYTVNPAVVWVQWSPDEYTRSLQGDLSWAGVVLQGVTGVYYPAPHNAGDPTLFDSRQKIAVPRKGSWGNTFVEILAEGPSLTSIGNRQTGFITYEGGLQVPATFVRENDGTLYLAQATWSSFVGLCLSTVSGEDAGIGVVDGLSWTPEIKAGPRVVYPDDLYFLDGNLMVACSNRLYLAYFSGPAGVNSLTYHWVRISKLPYVD